MLKIRQSRDRLIFNIGIPIPGKDGLYIETGPWLLPLSLLCCMPYHAFQMIWFKRIYFGCCYHNELNWTVFFLVIARHNSTMLSQISNLYSGIQVMWQQQQPIRQELPQGWGVLKEEVSRNNWISATQDQDADTIESGSVHVVWEIEGKVANLLTLQWNHMRTLSALVAHCTERPPVKWFQWNGNFVKIECAFQCF